MSDPASVPPAAKPPRRTQAERSQSTRKRVCEAVLDALVEVGYESISTTLVAEKAQVSRGALTHHFPMRNDLLVAAYQHLVDGWANRVPFAEGSDDDRLDMPALIDALWENIFSSPHYVASLELMLAARQDNELGRDIREVMVGWIHRRDSRVLTLMGSSIANEEDALFLQLLLSTMRGIAIHQSFDTDDEAASRLLEMWKEIATRVHADRHGSAPPQLP